MKRHRDLAEIMYWIVAILVLKEADGLDELSCNYPLVIPGYKWF